MPADLLARRLPLPGDLPQSMTLADAVGRCDAPEPEQRARSSAATGDLLLDAGAGSGKTSVLVERFVRAVLEDGVDVAAILTITFTEKAAAELRDRIRARLRELGAAEAARATEGAFISTIHGFCARVLRAHALARRARPRFAVLDRARRPSGWPTAAFDDALERARRATPGRRRAGRRLRRRAAARGDPRRLRGAALARRSSSPRLPALAAAPDLGAGARRARCGPRRAAAAELGAVAEPGARGASRRSSAWSAALRAIAARRSVAGRARRASRCPVATAPRSAPPACAAYGEALAAFRRGLRARAARPRRATCWTAAARLRRALRRSASASGSGLDFEDLELLAPRAAAADAELRERYRERFDADDGRRVPGHQPRCSSS